MGIKLLCNICDIELSSKTNKAGIIVYTCEFCKRDMHDNFEEQVSKIIGLKNEEIFNLNQQIINLRSELVEIFGITKLYELDHYDDSPIIVVNNHG